MTIDRRKDGTSATSSPCPSTLPRRREEDVQALHQQAQASVSKVDAALAEFDRVLGVLA